VTGPDPMASDTTDLGPADVTHDPRAGRFELELPDGRAYLRYRQTDDVMDLVSTWVPPSHRHRGIGETVVLAALEHARANGHRVIPTCPFVPHVLADHPEYSDLVDAG